MRLISGKLYVFALAAAAVATVATYIQGTFLVGGLPPLDGTDYDWSQASPERIKTIVLWVVLIAVAVFLCIKLNAKIIKGVAFISIALSFMLLASLVSVAVTNPVDYASDELRFRCSDKNLYNVSNDSNLLVLILDSVDNTTFQEALKSDSSVSDTFDDFTCYNNVLSGYGYTRESVPFLLSGQWYENECDISDYHNSALRDSPLFAALDERDYEIGLYADFDQKLSSDIFKNRFVNYLEGEDHFCDLLSSCKLFLRMAGIRYAPWDLKYFGYSINYAIRVSHDIVFFENDNLSLYKCGNIHMISQLLSDDPFEITNGKQCRIIHLDGAHVPFTYHKDLSVTTEEFPTTYEEEVAVCITLCDMYIDALKEQGVYDNSAIVITSDHGYSTKASPLYRANPILLVKGIGERHDEAIYSDAPISQGDYAEAFIGLLDGKAGNDIFAYAEGDERERRTMQYSYTKEYHMEEYVTTGHASDIEAFRATGNVYDLD